MPGKRKKPFEKGCFPAANARQRSWAARVECALRTPDPISFFQNFLFAQTLLPSAMKFVTLFITSQSLILRNAGWGFANKSFLKGCGKDFFSKKFFPRSICAFFFTAKNMKIHFDFDVAQFLSDIGKLNLEEKLLWKPGRQRDPVSGSCSGAVAIGLLSWAASTQYFDVLAEKG